MNILHFIYLFCLLVLTSSTPIKLNSFSELELQERYSEYIYNYSYPFTNTLITSNISHFYFFIKLSNYRSIDKIDKIIEFNGIEEKYNITLPKDNEKWIISEIHHWERNISVILRITTSKKKVKMKFMDSTKAFNIDIEQFINLNFNTDILPYNAYPLLCNIKSNSNVIFTIHSIFFYNIFDNSHYILNY